MHKGMYKHKDANAYVLYDGVSENVQRCVCDESVSTYVISNTSGHAHECLGCVQICTNEYLCTAKFVLD